jgi:hypothetical protein
VLGFVGAAEQGGPSAVALHKQLQMGDLAHAGSEKTAT